MTAFEKLTRLQELWRRVQSSEAYLLDATGSDRRAEMRHLNQLRREYRALREVRIDGIPETDGVAAALVGLGAA